MCFVTGKKSINRYTLNRACVEFSTIIKTLRSIDPFCYGATESPLSELNLDALSNPTRRSIDPLSEFGYYPNYNKNIKKKKLILNLLKFD